MIVDIPKFSTDNVIQWLYKVERFFRVYFIPDDQKVSIALFQFDGKVLVWFQMLEWSNQIPNWYSLATAIHLQFGPSQFDHPQAELLKFTQNTSVGAYYDSFIELAN